MAVIPANDASVTRMDVDGETVWSEGGGGGDALDRIGTMLDGLDDGGQPGPGHDRCGTGVGW